MWSLRGQDEVLRGEEGLADPQRGGVVDAK